MHARAQNNEAAVAKMKDDAYQAGSQMQKKLDHRSLPPPSTPTARVGQSYVLQLLGRVYPLFCSSVHTCNVCVWISNMHASLRTCFRQPHTPLLPFSSTFGLEWLEVDSVNAAAGPLQIGSHGHSIRELAAF